MSWRDTCIYLSPIDVNLLKYRMKYDPEDDIDTVDCVLEVDFFPIGDVHGGMTCSYRINLPKSGNARVKKI